MTIQEASSLVNQNKLRNKHRQEIYKTIAWLVRKREKKIESYNSRIRSWQKILQEDEARNLQNYLG